MKNEMRFTVKTAKGQFNIQRTPPFATPAPNSSVYAKKRSLEPTSSAWCRSHDRGGRLRSPPSDRSLLLASSFNESFPCRLRSFAAGPPADAQQTARGKMPTGVVTTANSICENLCRPARGEDTGTGACCHVKTSTTWELITIFVMLLLFRWISYAYSGSMQHSLHDNNRSSSDTAENPLYLNVTNCHHSCQKHYKAWLPDSSAVPVLVNTLHTQNTNTSDQRCVSENH